MHLKNLSHGNNQHKKELTLLTEDGQTGCYLGNWTELLNYMKTADQKTVTSAAVLTKLRKNRDWWPPAFKVRNLDVINVMFSSIN